MILKSVLPAILLATLAPAALADAGPAAPPNVVFILVDDLGWRELGSYGSSFNETPHLDRLSAGGMRFTSAYAAAPVCSPVRAALMTGQYPARVGITNYLRADDEEFLKPDYHTIAEAFRSAGYATGLIGKWHLMGDYARRRGAPSLHGFDEIICSETGYIAGGDYFGPYQFMPDVKPRSDNEYLTDRLNLEAVEFIRRHKDRPFFLYLSHYAVHTKLAARPEMIQKFSQKPGAGEKKNNPTLAAMLASIDDGVGQIMAVLDDLNLARNTMVVFTSDNGGESRVTSNAPLRGAKSELYEGGIRVPLIIRWPNLIPEKSESDVPVTSVDFYPTFLELTNTRSPNDHVCDGQSLVPVLKGKGKMRSRALYWHYPLDKPHFLGGRSSGAIRSGQFKLIEFFDTGNVELYDLNRDIGETTNLADTMPDKAKEFQQLLATWRANLGVTIYAVQDP